MSRFHRSSPLSSRRLGDGRRASRPATVPAFHRRAEPAGLHLRQWAEGSPGGGSWVLVAVAGEIDAQTASYLLSALTRTMGINRQVCCDLSSVRFIGAAGANVLALAHLRASAARGRFSVRGVRGLTAQVLEITGLDTILTVVD